MDSVSAVNPVGFVSKGHLLQPFDFQMPARKKEKGRVKFPGTGSSGSNISYGSTNQLEPSVVTHCQPSH